MSIIFFTGTRGGLSSASEDWLIKQLVDTFQKARQLRIEAKFIHGCCTGSDEQFHGLLSHFLREDFRGVANEGLISIELFPSDLPQYTAHSLNVWLGVPIKIHPPSPPLARNVEMARICTECWANPATMKRGRSGTWHAIGAVRQFGKEVKSHVPLESHPLGRM